MNDHDHNDADIFNLEGVRSAAAEPSASSSKPIAKPPRTSSIGPLHFGALAGALATVWIVWPHVMSASPSQEGLASAPSANIAPAPLPAGAPVDGRIASTDPLAVLPAAAEPLQPSIKETELQAQVAVLRDELTAAHERLMGCAIPSAPVAAPTVSPAPRAAKIRKASTAAAPNAPTLEQRAKLAGFSLNTVYNQQAWIEQGNRTHVVAQGDIVDGIRILRIDVGARKVITDAGEIR